MAVFLFSLLSFPWLTDLDDARDQARREGKILFHRQVRCTCGALSCDRAEAARRSWYLDDERVREVLLRECVPVLHHTPHDLAGLRDLTRTPTEKTVATFLIDAEGHVLHRLDLCGRETDVIGEIEFALRIRSECFTPEGWPRENAERLGMTLLKRHEETLPHPLGCSCVPADRCGSTKPWKGYYAGAVWHTDLTEAMPLAEKSGKLLLYYQIVGDLHREGC